MNYVTLDDSLSYALYWLLKVEADDINNGHMTKKYDQLL